MHKPREAEDGSLSKKKKVLSKLDSAQKKKKNTNAARNARRERKPQCIFLSEPRRRRCRNGPVSKKNPNIPSLAGSISNAFNGLFQTDGYNNSKPSQSGEETLSVARLRRSSEYKPVWKRGLSSQRSRSADPPKLRSPRVPAEKCP